MTVITSNVIRIHNVYALPVLVIGLSFIKVT